MGNRVTWFWGLAALTYSAPAAPAYAAPPPPQADAQASDQVFTDVLVASRKPSAVSSRLGVDTPVGVATLAGDRASGQGSEDAWLTTTPVTIVPEPKTAVLVGLGLACLAIADAMARRSRRARNSGG
jgi:hypothetical protein